MSTLGAIVLPQLPPERLLDTARAADEAGLDELWLWEDCFWTSGLSAAAAILGATRRVRVGVGLLPVPLRNVALTAMELATLARLFPGRLVPGVGHGVLDWMGQVGARASSPMTLLSEYTTALRELLRGQAVSTSGRYVTLEAVRLTWPPEDVPPVLVGAIGPRTLALAGAVGDGVILTGETALEEAPEAVRRVRAARADAGIDTAPEVVVFVRVAGRPAASDVAAQVTEFADAGATTVALHSVGENAPPLTEFARFIGGEVQPLLG